MSKSPRALQELMTAVDAGHGVDVYIDSTSSDSRRELLGPRQRRSTPTYYGRGAGARKSAPVVAVVDTSSDASFEFSTAVNSYSSASPASMVFSNGQLRAHQFPAVRPSPSTGSSHSTSPLRGSSVGSSYSSTGSGTKQQARLTGSKKRVSFATDGADKSAAAGKDDGGRQKKKSGGLLGCCGLSSGNEAMEPVARNVNRKVVAF